MVVGDLDIRIFCGEPCRDLVPEHHRVLLGVRLGHRGELAAALARLLEAEAQDALDTLAGEDRGLDGDLVGRAVMDASAGPGIFALGVLADAEDVEGAGTQWPLDARQQAVRANIGVLHEGLADRQQEPVQRDRIRHALGPADRAEQDRVEAAQGLDAIRRHHRAGLLVEVAGPGEARPFEPEAATMRGAAEHLPGGLGDGGSDAVTRDQGDLVGFHGEAPHSAIRTLFDLRFAR